MSIINQCHCHQIQINFKVITLVKKKRIRKMYRYLCKNVRSESKKLFKKYIVKYRYQIIYFSTVTKYF